MSQSPRSKIAGIFFKEIEGYLPEIEIAISILQDSAADVETLSELYRLFHNIKGAASQLKYSGLSHSAGLCEAVVGNLLESESTIIDIHLDFLNNVTARICDFCSLEDRNSDAQDLLLNEALVEFTLLDDQLGEEKTITLPEDIQDALSQDLRNAAEITEAASPEHVQVQLHQEECLYDLRSIVPLLQELTSQSSHGVSQSIPDEILTELSNAIETLSDCSRLAGLPQHHDLLSNFLLILHQLKNSPELVDNEASELLQDFLSYVDLVFSLPASQGEVIILKIQDQLSAIRNLLLSPVPESIVDTRDEAVVSTLDHESFHDTFEDDSLDPSITSSLESTNVDDYDKFLEFDNSKSVSIKTDFALHSEEFEIDEDGLFETDIEPPEEFPQASQPNPDSDNHSETESTLAIDDINTLQEEEDELFAIFRAECDEHLQAIKAELLALENIVTEPVQITFDILESLNVIRHGVTTIKGAAAMTGFSDIADSANALEDLLDWFHEDSTEIIPGDVDLISEALDYMESLSTSLQHEGAGTRVPILISIGEYLKDRRDSELAESILEDTIEFSSTTETEGLDSESLDSSLMHNDSTNFSDLNIFNELGEDVTIDQLPEIEDTADEPVVESPQSTGLSEEEEQELLFIFRAECNEQLQGMTTGLNTLKNQIQTTTILTATHRETVSAVRRQIHTIKGAAAMTGFDNLASCAHEVEDLLDWLHDSSSTIKPLDIAVIFQAVELIATLTQAETLEDSDKALLLSETVANHLLQRSAINDNENDAFEPAPGGLVTNTFEPALSPEIFSEETASEFEKDFELTLDDVLLQPGDELLIAKNVESGEQGTEEPFTNVFQDAPQSVPIETLATEFEENATDDQAGVFEASLQSATEKKFEEALTADVLENLEDQQHEAFTSSFEDATSEDLEEAIAAAFGAPLERENEITSAVGVESPQESALEIPSDPQLEKIDPIATNVDLANDNATGFIAEPTILTEIDEDSIVTDLEFTADEDSYETLSGTDGLTKEEQQELLIIFQAECEEHLQDINSELNSLSNAIPVTSPLTPEFRESISSLRRGIHTIKGAAAMTGFDNLASCAHEVEDLLDWLHDSSSNITPEDVNVIAEATDIIETLAQSDSADDTAKVTQTAEAVAVHLNLRSNISTEEIEACATVAEETITPVIPEESNSAREPEDISFTDHDLVVAEKCNESIETDELHDESEIVVQTVLSNTDESELSSEDNGLPEEPMTEVLDNSILAADAVVPAAQELIFKRAPEVITETSNMPTDTGNVRVNLNDLDELVNIEGDLVVARGSIEKLMERFSESLNELNTIKDTLRRKSQELEIGFEAQSLYGFGSGQLANGAAGPEGINSSLSDFDPIELDRYSQLNLIIRSLNELSIDVNAIHSEMTALGSSLEGQVVKQQLSMGMMQEKLMRIRMTPLSSISRMMFRTVRQTAKRLKKKVQLTVTGEDVFMDRYIWTRTIDPLMHILRNCVDHGIEDIGTRQNSNKPQTGQISLEANQRGRFVVLRISDDGNGVNIDKLRNKLIAENIIPADARLSDEELLPYIFRPSVSTRDDVSQISGRGVGLDVVQRNIQELRGTVQIINSPGEGVTFELSIPITLSVNRAIIVNLSSRQFAVPIQDINEVRKFKRDEIDPEDPRNVIYQDQSIPLIQLKQQLQLPATPEDNLEGDLLSLVVNTGEQLVAMQIDSVDEQREIVIKDLGSHLHYVKGINGVTLTGEGSIIPILNLRELSKVNSQKIITQPVIAEAVGQGPLKVLVVDDSISVRFSITRLVKNQSWEAIQATDGIDALEKLEEVTPDAIILDIEMPRMNGYEFLGMIRSNEKFSNIPVIMLTSRASEKHRKKAEELGANHYMTKPFHEDYFIELLSTMQQSHSIQPFE